VLPKRAYRPNLLRDFSSRSSKVTLLLAAEVSTRSKTITSSFKKQQKVYYK
jgi:hypothetical protein